MILDKRNEFADGVAVAGAAAVRNAGDTIPLGSARDLGNGQPMYFYVQVDTAPTGADTVEFQLVSDSTAEPATNGTATTHLRTGAVAIASLPAGKRYVYALPLEGAVYEEFLGLQVVNVGAGALAALVVTAGLTLDPAGWQAYPEGQN